jgi:hypothetical protein
LLKRNDTPPRSPTIDVELGVNQPRFDITDSRDVACLVNLFYNRVRHDLFSGPTAEDANNSAARIAATMEHNLIIDHTVQEAIIPKESCDIVDGSVERIVSSERSSKLEPER